MEKLMERAVVVVNRSKRSGYRRNARVGSATGHYKICATPPRKPSLIEFYSAGRRRIKMRPRNGNLAPFSLHPSADLIYPGPWFIDRPPPSTLPRDFARIRPTDRRLQPIEGLLAGDEGRGPCSIGGTINRTSYLEQPSNLSFFAPNSFSRRRSWGCCGERRRFGNDFKN